MSLAIVKLMSKVHLVDEAAIRIHIIVIFLPSSRKEERTKKKAAAAVDNIVHLRRNK